ncbi:hypothetical protein IU443_28505 [Nocardia farcinica]|uniref:hypothetical protein n=1 Tax=Nocardia farcinica TaxID=37329 RepID=UPI001893563B|nr:hypothetical protein [Nocardia farcinica]MBF6393874.1 hypothetical protein [Nocardia farcinica]
MSYTTDLTLCVAYPRDRGIRPFLDKIAAVERFGDAPERIDTSAAGGTRNYIGAIYAMGSNHFPTEELQDIIDSVRWDFPDRVVLVACSERFAMKVIRPAFEYEERWGDYSMAYQPAFVETGGQA